MAEENVLATNDGADKTAREKSEYQGIEECVAENQRLREQIANLEQANAEIKAQQERTLRTAAYYENIRRRAEQELQDLRKYGHERLAKKILPVVDSLVRALEATKGTTDVAAFREGVEMVLKQLEDALASEGITLIPTAGERFDPHVHEAIAQHPTDEVPENTIVGELQRGYMLNDRLLRAATVLIAVSSAKEQARDES